MRSINHRSPTVVSGFAFFGFLAVLWRVPSFAQCDPSCNSNQGCNRLKVESILPPDQDHFTVYINIQTTCGTKVIKSCKTSFSLAAGGEIFTTQEKCSKLVDTINGDPSCTTAGYIIPPVDNHCAEPNPYFILTDTTCPGGVLSLGISNDPSIFNQEENGVPIPDYEAELITPFCTDPTPQDPTNGDEIQHDVTLGGKANSVPIVEEEPSHVEVVVCIPTGGVDCRRVEAEVQTHAGQLPEEIVAELAAKLRAQDVLVIQNGRSLRVLQPRDGKPIGVAVGTADEGITSAITVGSAKTLPTVQGRPIPVLPRWGVVGLTLTIATVGAMVLLFRRRQVTVGAGRPSRG